MELLYKNPEQISLMRDIGVKGLAFGIESLNHASAKAIGKGLHPDKILETAQKCKDTFDKHTLLYASMMIGLPHDSKETVSKWGGMLVRGETPFDSYDFKILRIYSKRNQGVHVSAIDADPAKFGYNFDPITEYWTNEHWNSNEELQEVARDLHKRRKYCKMSVWLYRNARGYGYSKDYLVNIKRNSDEYFEFKSDLKHKYKKKIEYEKDLIFK